MPCVFSVLSVSSVANSFPGGKDALDLHRGRGLRQDRMPRRTSNVPLQEDGINRCTRVLELILRIGC